MKNTLILVGALLCALAPATQAASNSRSVEVRIDTSKLDAAHGWEAVTDGVFQRIDADGTISTVSVGEAGMRHDLALAKTELARTRQELRNALERNVDASNLQARIGELQQTIKSLDLDQFQVQSKGTVEVEDGTEFCHGVAGTFGATFSKQPRPGGGMIGSVTTTTGTRPCYPGYDFCPPFEDYAPNYRGGTRSSASATNSGGVYSQQIYSNNAVSVDMYTMPWVQTYATTPNVADPVCTLVAGGMINTTRVTTEYGTCHLYRHFGVVKTCAQVP